MSENAWPSLGRQSTGTRRETRLGSLLCTLPLIAGCAAQIDFKRVAYEALRREDCRRNQLDEFCERTFANEYAEYERLRRHFVQNGGERRQRPAVTGDAR